jgi:hypothetical protein
MEVLKNSGLTLEILLLKLAFSVAAFHGYILFVSLRENSLIFTPKPQGIIRDMAQECVLVMLL